MEKSNQPVEKAIRVPNVLLPTLERLSVHTIGELANLQLHDAAQMNGVGPKKVASLKELIFSARSLLAEAPKPSLTTDNIFELRIESKLEVSGALTPTLTALGVLTIGDLAEFDFSRIQKLSGIGKSKTVALKTLVQDAKDLVSEHVSQDPSSDFRSESFRTGMALRFVPSILKATFERDSVSTINDLYSIDAESVGNRTGWGAKKIRNLKSLQQLYNILNSRSIEYEEILGTIVGKCLLPLAELGDLSIRQLLEGETEVLKLKGAAKSDTDGLRALFAALPDIRRNEIQKSVSRFSEQLNQTDWRDVPLNLAKRVVAFLDRFELNTVADLEIAATSGMVVCPKTNEKLLVSEQENFGASSFAKLKKELSRLAKLGLESYREGLVCGLEELPSPNMKWRAVPMRFNSRTQTFLTTFQVETLQNVHRISVRGQVVCPVTSQNLNATEQKGFSDRSLLDLRTELLKLANYGLEKYRYGANGTPASVAALSDLAMEFLDSRNFEVVKRRCHQLTLEEVAEQMNLTRERIRQIEVKSIEKLKRLSAAATDLLKPIDSALHKLGTVQTDPFLSTLGASSVWQIFLAAKIAGKTYNLTDGGMMSLFSSSQSTVLESLVKNVLSDPHRAKQIKQLSIKSLLGNSSGLNKKINAELSSLVELNDVTLTGESLFLLTGTDWLRTHVRALLVEAGINGLAFEEINTLGTAKSVSELVEILGDEVDVMANGRLRRPGKVYRNLDEIVEIVKSSSKPISSSEIIDQCSIEWLQPHLVKYLSNCYETIQTERGRYVHISVLGIDIEDVIELGSWGAELLAGEKTQVDGETLLDLYQHSKFDFKITNEYQLVSIISKHPEVRRVSNNLNLAHRDSFDEAQLFLSVTDPDLANQWHPTKNGKATPENVRPTTNKIFWWRCELGHEFQLATVYRTRSVRRCPLCEGRWTITKIRHFVKSLIPHLDSLTPAELYVIFQQSGLAKTGGKAKGFVKALTTGRFPKKELKKFAERQGSLVDDFLGDDELLLEESQTESNEEVPSQPGAELVNEPVAEANDEKPPALPEVRTKKALEALDNAILASTDSEAAEFLVASGKAKIWNHAYQDATGAVREAENFSGTKYAEQVRAEFLSEYESACNLKIPDGYDFRIAGQLCHPNLMQRHVASQIQSKSRFGNWSGTGAGKTLSAILATRVSKASLTVVCCPNAVVGETSDGWATEILRVFPDSEVITKTLTPSWLGVGGNHRYLVLNYEQFQKPNSESNLKKFVESNQVDFIVIDEVHYAKQRFSDHMSKRKKLLQGLVAASFETNPKLRVLGLSATPVINNLQEGRSLVEMITGVEHEDISVKPTVPNCMRLHQKLATMGTRWRPKYDAKLEIKTVDVECSKYLPEIRELETKHSPLELEKILTRARLTEILNNIAANEATLIYTHYVSEIDQTLYRAIRDAGHNVGFYTGSSKEGIEPFKAGDINVLIGSSSIGTGVDGLQHVCDKLIINVLPWTNAEFEQLIGRVWRQGQSSDTVEVIIPVTYADVNGSRWSYCESKLKRIRYKKSIADAAVDGAVPEGNLRSPAQAQKDVMLWLERLENGLETTILRRKIVVPLSGDENESDKRLAQYGDFSTMNNRWNQSKSENLLERLSKNPEEWEQYHTHYRDARVSWAVTPFLEMITWCKKREGYVIGDFGCGEA